MLHSFICQLYAQVPSLARCSSTEDLVVSKTGGPVLTGDTNENTEGW